MILNSTTRSILPQKTNFHAHKYIFLHLVNLSAIQSQKCLKIKFKRIIKCGQVFCAKISSTGNHNIDLTVLSTTHIWRILHIMWTIMEGLGRYFTRMLCYECSVAPFFFSMWSRYLTWHHDQEAMSWILNSSFNNSKAGLHLPVDTGDKTNFRTCRVKWVLYLIFFPPNRYSMCHLSDIRLILMHVFSVQVSLECWYQGSPVWYDGFYSLVKTHFEVHQVLT